MAAAAPEVVVRGNAAGFSQAIRAGLHELASDEPLDKVAPIRGPRLMNCSPPR